MDHESNSTVSGKGVFKHEIFIYYNACRTSVELVFLFLLSLFPLALCGICLFCFLRQNFAYVAQVGLSLTAVLLPLPPQC